MIGTLIAHFRYPETVLQGAMVGLCLSALLINEGAISVTLACVLCAAVFAVALSLPRLRSNASEAKALYRSTRLFRMGIYVFATGMMRWLYLRLGPHNEASHLIPWMFASVSTFALAQDIRMGRLNAAPVAEPGASAWMTVWASLESGLLNPWAHAATMIVLFAAACAIFVIEGRETFLWSILGLLAVVVPIVLIGFAALDRKQLTPERERLGRLPIAIVGILALGAGAVAKAIDPETVLLTSSAALVAMLSASAIATMLTSSLVAQAVRPRDTA